MQLWCAQKITPKVNSKWKCIYTISSLWIYSELSFIRGYARSLVEFQLCKKLGRSMIDRKKLLKTFDFLHRNVGFLTQKTQPENYKRWDETFWEHHNDNADIPSEGGIFQYFQNVVKTTSKTFS